MPSSALYFLVLLGLASAALGSEKKKQTSSAGAYALAESLMSRRAHLVAPIPVEVFYDLNLVKARFNRETEVLSSHIWELMSWKDPRLIWDSEEYGGVNHISLPAKYVWTPDIKLYNPYFVEEPRGEVNVVINNDGMVLWVPPTFTHTECGPGSADESTEYICHIKFGSWTLNGGELKLTAASFNSSRIDLTSYEPSRQFQLLSATKQINSLVYDCCPDPYMDYDAVIRIKLLD